MLNDKMSVIGMSFCVVNNMTRNNNKSTGKKVKIQRKTAAYDVRIQSRKYPFQKKEQKKTICSIKPINTEWLETYKNSKQC